MQRWTGVTVALFAVCALASPSLALDIQPTGDAKTLADAIGGGGGIVVKSVKYDGGAQASGTYTAGPLGMADGTILTSGAAVNALPPNNNTGAGTNLNLPGDPLCNALAGGVGTYDAARLEIVFTLPPGASGIRFEYVVGSEEYPEYVGSVNDVAGIFVDGVNKALDKEGNAITINGPFFSGASVITDSGTQYDGSTPRLQAAVPLAGGDHTMVVIVCDAVDGILDTGIFVASLGACSGDCNSVAWCGDGKKDPGEDCDDGNNKDGDGCGNTCKLEAVCGDGLCFVDESCDSCPADCGECPAVCGNGKCDGDEDSCSCQQDCPDDPDSCSECECGVSGGSCYCDAACVEAGDCCTNACDSCGYCPATCGDELCSEGESCEDCPLDCGVCPGGCEGCAQCGEGCDDVCPADYTCSQGNLCVSDTLLSVEGTSDGDVMGAELVPADSGIVVKSAVFDGFDCSSGTFINGPLGMGEGIVLTTGLVKSALPPNDATGTSTAFSSSAANEPYCSDIAGTDVFDAAKLTIEFELLPGQTGIKFGYLFGSEEYPEYVGQFNDVGGVFLDGVNVAMDAEGNPITINGPFFSGGQVVTENGTEYDGATPFLNYCAKLEPGIHKIEIVVCDALDSAYDSAIFVSSLTGMKGDCGGVAEWCGDGACNAQETCESCQADCGACSLCGDGQCLGDETCGTCWEDCGECPPFCGDGECNGDDETETCTSCPQDCGECPDPFCGDNLCNGDETCTSCPGDCPKCPPAKCGDGTCNGEESCDNCEEDCGECEPSCGDCTCNGEETCKDCPDDCGECGAECGNSVCEEGETCKSCPNDCACSCGDGICFKDEDGSDESCESCTEDCGECPDGYGYCDGCPESCEAEPDYSGVMVSGGPSSCSAAPVGTSTAVPAGLLLVALAPLALLFLRRRSLRTSGTLLSVLLFSMLVAMPASALEITTTNDAQGLAKALLGGGGIEIKSANFTGHAEAAGTYAAGPLGIGNGSILTSGTAQNALPPNDEPGMTASFGLPGDPLCDQLAGGVSTGDAAKLEIVFSLKEGFDGIRFDYVVGSEEYPEYVGEFNDTVGIFVDGVNKALDAEGNAITINGPFFSGTEVVTDSGTEYDGSTPRLQQKLALTPGEHTVILVVCDALDTSLDTGMFVAAFAGCKGDCDTTSWCGDGKVDEGEDCDDGNNTDGDGCDNTCKLEAVCGDGKCYVDETCEGCPADCGECEPECGDGICSGDETCESCEVDCNCEAVCGDTICNGDETCGSCPGDCGECEPECGDNLCNGDEDCTSCPADCPKCPPSVCGDNNCDPGETCATCEDDCGECEPECGDGECNGEETCTTCKDDCGECAPECGDGVCSADEDCETCEEDCDCSCGDGICFEDEEGNGESCLSCEKDCGKCPPKCETCEPPCDEEDSELEVSGGVTSCSASPLTGAPAPFAGLLLMGGLALTALGLRRRFFRSGLLVALTVAVAAITLAPSTAMAQQDVQIESQFFKPSPFVHDYFTVGTGDVMGECRWDVGLMLNYQNDPLVLRTTGGTELGSLVEHQVTGDLLAAVKILDWLGIGLDVPVVLMQQGEDIEGFPGAGVAGVGDIRLVPRARLYQTGDGLFTLGAELIVTFPTGKLIDPYMGRNGFGFLPRLLASLDFGRGGVALNAGALIATGEDKALNVDTGHAIDTRLGGWVGLVPEKLDLIAELGTQMKLTEPMKNMENNPMEALGGLKWHVIPGLDVSAGAGGGLTEGAAAPDFRVFAGVMYSSCCKAEEPPPPKPFCDADPDGDKLCSPCVFEQNREEEFAAVCKGKDECPAEPEDFDNFEDSEGCPDPDNDKDGICDPWVAEKNLADKYKELCRLSDQCPDEPEDADGFEDDDGCPDPDNDQDKICDPWVEEKGLADKYKDICKPTDKCPTEPETVNSYQDEDGCPDKAVVIEKKKIVILQKVEFYFDETRIKEESFPLLDEVVQTLKDNPQIKKIRVEGHTDERGNDKYNMKLSSGRVETVMKYLAEKGIDSKRLSFKGFGESRPLIKNAQTEEDHQRNRRVEFIILEMDEQ